MTADRRLVLASASPARLSLLRQAGLAPDVVVSQVDESTVKAPRVAEQVALLASMKAAAVAKQETDALVIGADSLLEFHGKPLGKPADAADARRAELIAEYEDTLANPYIAADRGYVDAVIPPSQTRIQVTKALRVLANKRQTLPPKKHGNIPL